jgi:type IV secretory pathway VirJ component
MAASDAKRSRITLRLASALLLPFALTAGARPAVPENLPIVIRPATRGTSDTFAIMLSGDGGWRRLDILITNELRKEGISVVGLLSNSYFTPRRTPEEAAADLERLITGYSQDWNKSHVILIGYSRGADVLPFLINHLTSATRAKVTSVALLGLEPTIDFKYHASWIPFYHPHEPQYPVRPEIDRMRGMNILCVYGEKESDSLCPSLPPQIVRPLRMPGRHHFGGRYGDVARAILSANTRR